MHPLSDPIFINISEATLNGSKSNEVRNYMIVKSLKIQNFRCICDETLPCEQLTVLVGRNGSGKSAFLHALNAFYNANSRYTEEDFYARDTSQDIIITVTFNDLTDEERTLFQKYVEGEHLTVEKVMTWPAVKGAQKYYGTSLQNPEFETFRTATGANLRVEYNKLRSLDKYSSLPTYSNRDQAQEALSDWEMSNPTNCVRQRDNGQFFGFKEVGEAHLERWTRFLFVPAVREATEDAIEARGSALTDIMDLVVRSVLSQRADIRALQEDTQEKYEALFDPSNIPELQSLGGELTSTLKMYVPDTYVQLTWISGQGIEIPMPKADIKLVEDEYPSSVSHTGHGLQRAFILTMLQHLALVQIPKQETEAVSGTATERAEFKIPNLILGIEEPELYQHPNRQRHLSKIFQKLATGSIKGVAEKTQIICSTHSPLFIEIDRFHSLRILRKEPGEQGKPKRTKVLWTTLDEVARIIEKADGKPDGTYTGETLQPRLKTLMTPWMNEGFFADVAVLVEGEEDRAAIIGAAYVMGVDLESIGISVIPCLGKSNLDRPIAIFSKLGITTYAIWDSDEGEKDVKPEDNHRLLRLFGKTIEDWPNIIEDNFACFKCTLTKTLRTEIGEPLYDSALNSCCERLCLGKKKHAVKNPMVIQEILNAAQSQGQSSKTINEIVTRILALAK